MFLFCQAIFDEQVNVEMVYEFTEEEKRTLNSTPMDKKSDALFARHLLEFLYKNNLNALENRSCSGRTRKQKQDTNEFNGAASSEFKAITPEKKRIIFEEFSKRIQNSSVATEEKLIRLDSNYISGRIKTAIGTVRKNISKKKQ